uniref:Uncharacterized protein n=1 Tax=Arundo donax TaxID=35708 RepID=A0A0A9HU49_ARUDO
MGAQEAGKGNGSTNLQDRRNRRPIDGQKLPRWWRRCLHGGGLTQPERNRAVGGARPTDSACGRRAPWVRQSAASGRGEPTLGRQGHSQRVGPAMHGL